MITREAIENYAEIQGGRCLEVFSMREHFLSDKRKKDTAQAYLDQRIQLLAKKSRNIPLDKSRRVEYFLGEYDLDPLMLQFRQLSEEHGKSLGATMSSFFLGWAVAKAFEFLTDLDVKETTSEERRQIVEGLVLVSLWDKAK